MMMQKLRGVLCFVLLSFLALAAGTPTALVTSSVFDQNGAPVPNATVRLLNGSVGYSRAVKTGADGTFTFTNVPPSEGYIISVEVSGFATIIRPGMAVKVGEIRQVLPPFLMQPSQQPGQEIREEPPAVAPIVVEFLSPTKSEVIDRRMLSTLPLRNRDFLDLALLVSGAYPVEQGSPLEGASLVVNGVRANMNNFLLDGADNNDYTINQSLPFQLVAALQEYRIQTSTSEAEYGRNAGAQINSVTQSGTNTFHGEVFYFYRGSGLSAKNALSSNRGSTFDAFVNNTRLNRLRFGANAFYPNDLSGDPVVRQVTEAGRGPGFNLNQFGANIGGPLKRDKAYFFINWESFRADNDRPVAARVPNAQLRDLTDQGLGISPVSDQLLALYPRPNIGPSTATDFFGDPAIADPVTPAFITDASFFQGEAENFTETDNLLFRTDFNPTDSVNLSFKYNIQQIDQLQAGSLPATTSYPGNGILGDGRNQSLAANYLHTLGPSASNEFRFGLNQFRLDTLPQDHTLSPAGIFQNLNFTDRGFPRFLTGGSQSSFGPLTDLGAPFSAPSFRKNTVLSFSDSFTLVTGSHIFKAGVEFRHNTLDVNKEGLGRGLVTCFTDIFCANTDAGDIATIPRVSDEFGGTFAREFEAFSFNWFLQDTWRMHSNFSLTYGIRYEVNQAPREKNDRLVNNYPGACGLRLVCLIRSGTNETFDADGARLGTSSFTAPRGGFETDMNNLGPHIGLAWNPGGNGSKVLRASYAVFFDQQPLEATSNMLLNPPFVQQAMSLFPFFFMGDIFPAGFPGDFSFFDSSSGQTFSGIDLSDVNGDGFSSFFFRQPFSIVSRDPKTRTPYVQQFNLNWQQQVGGSSLFEIAYVGSVGSKLPRNRLLLECTADRFDINIDPFAFRDCLHPALRFPGVPTRTDSIVQQENSSNSNFHSLQLRWETRNFKGLTARINYQWAHSIDVASSSTPPVFLLSPATASTSSFFFGINVDQFAALNNGNPALSIRPGFPVISTRSSLANDSLNSGNLRGERASSDFDARHRFVISHMYDIPKWAPAIGTGWQLAGITTFQSGQPFTVFGDFFGVPLRPDLASQPAINTSNPDGAIDGAIPVNCTALNPCVGTASISAFDLTASQNFLPGSLGRNTFTGPGLINFDFSFIKNSRFGSDGRVNLQFRAEFFNIFNHANFRQPFSQVGQSLSLFGLVGFTVPNPFFGQILQARNPREIQLSLRLTF